MNGIFSYKGIIVVGAFSETLFCHFDIPKPVVGLKENHAMVKSCVANT